MQQKNYPQMPSIKVAFLGLGVMGYPMAGHLARAGLDVWSTTVLLLRQLNGPLSLAAGLLQLPEKRRVELNLYLPVSAMTMI